jgi:hypothetical protein
MELNIERTDTHYKITISMSIEETGDPESRTYMEETTLIPLAQCEHPDTIPHVTHGAASHLLHKMINRWRIPLTHATGQAMGEAIRRYQRAHGEVPSSASEAGAAIPVAATLPTTPPMTVRGGRIIGDD